MAAAALAAGMIAWTAPATAALPSEGYADLVEKVSPAVVTISITQKGPEREPTGNSPRQSPFPFPFPPGSPFEEFFKRFEDQMPQQRRGPRLGLGSGFIIDAQGHIVTNHHVVANAEEIKAKLQDGRELVAEVVGTDQQTDLALLRIKADKSLPYVSFGDSDRLRPGHIVLAVGNAFGLGGTVTAGIVSAHNRNINAGPYDDFIQTDAAINRGNSGGPLFNTSGEVVGVNTAIYSPTGGSVGIGFAIPANLAKQIIAELKENGKVERGWLGVKIQQVGPQIAEAMGLDKPAGALVAEVTPGSPAASAGLRQGDIITGFNGRAIGEMRDLPRLVAETDAGQSATIEVWRNGKRQALPVTIGRLKPETVASADASPAAPDGAVSKSLGAELAVLDDRVRASLNLPQDARGVVVTRVEPDGRAAAAGLRSGDVIERVGSTTIRRPADIAKALESARTSAVLVLVNRAGDKFFIGIKRTDA
jgi:serine protease Do